MADRLTRKERAAIAAYRGPVQIISEGSMTAAPLGWFNKKRGRVSKVNNSIPPRYGWEEPRALQSIAREVLKHERL